MNRARVAALLRELADEIDEGGAVPVEAPSRVRVKKDRRPPALTRPAGEADPAVQAMAQNVLNRSGFR